VHVYSSPYFKTDDTQIAVKCTWLPDMLLNFHKQK